MEKPRKKVVNFQQYKEKKIQLQPDRRELLNLIKKVVTTK